MEGGEELGLAGDWGGCLGWWGRRIAGMDEEWGGGMAGIVDFISYSNSKRCIHF
jgi:hypothetical protein